MKSYGAKSLIKLDEKTVLEHQLQKIHHTFIQYEIILVIGFEANKVHKHIPKNIKVVVNPHYEKTNVAYSIALGLTEATTQNVLVIYGDLVFNLAALKLPLLNESLITIDPSGEMKKDEVGCVAKNNLLTNMMYGLPEKWGQIMFLTGKELRLFQEIMVFNSMAYKWFGFEVLNQVISEGGRFRTFAPKNAVSIDVDTSKDIHKAQQICKL